METDQFVTLPTPDGKGQIVANGNYRYVEGEGWVQMTPDGVMQHEDMKPETQGNGCLAVLAKYFPFFFRA